MDEFLRPLDWDGAVNAWHIAGGVFRMGRREWLTEAGWQQAYDAGIRTVVDLRNPEERLRRDSDPSQCSRTSPARGKTLSCWATSGAMPGINDHHRVSGTPHPHERYLPDEVLTPLLQTRANNLLKFIRRLHTREFLRRNGVTPPELAAILAKLGG